MFGKFSTLEKYFEDSDNAVVLVKNYLIKTGNCCKFVYAESLKYSEYFRKYENFWQFSKERTFSKARTSEMQRNLGRYRKLQTRRYFSFN
jgi:hypothetical protein